MTHLLRMSAPGRVLPAIALLALSVLLGSCRTYVFLPVDVAYETLSPPYVVSLRNDTGAPFEVLPSSSGARAGYAGVRVQPGEEFRAILQLRRLRVGAQAPVAGAQVLDNPYFEQSPPDKAELRIVQGDPHSLLIAIQHPAWFDGYERPDAIPAALSIPLREFSRTPLFPRGPLAGP